MKVAVFGTKSYDRIYFEFVNKDFNHEFVYYEPHLNRETAKLAAGFPAVCVFVNDQLNAEVLEALSESGTKLIALRCAGFNNVDIAAAGKLGMRVVRVPAYSPYAVAEHTLGLILTLNRKIHRAHARVREGNFALEGLLGFDLHGRTVGVIGTGKIGAVVVRIMHGFGCKVLAYDPYPNQDVIAAGGEYVELDELFAHSDIVTLHCPLTPDTHHIINAHSIGKMKDGVMLINTSRGALIDTRAVIHALKSGRIGYMGLDVYEEEAHLFFRDLSNEVLQDDIFARLLTFPNVVITGHQAFFTRDALENIARTTLGNIRDFELGNKLENEVKPEVVV